MFPSTTIPFFTIVFGMIETAGVDCAYPALPTYSYCVTVTDNVRAFDGEFHELFVRITEYVPSKVAFTLVTGTGIVAVVPLPPFIGTTGTNVFGEPYAGR